MHWTQTSLRRSVIQRQSSFRSLTYVILRSAEMTLKCEFQETLSFGHVEQCQDMNHFTVRNAKMILRGRLVGQDRVATRQPPELPFHTGGRKVRHGYLASAGPLAAGSRWRPLCRSTLLSQRTCVSASTGSNEFSAPSRRDLTA